MKLGRMTMKKRESIAGYLFILPFIIGFIFLFLNPIIESIKFSVSEVVVGGSKFIGFANYIYLFTEDKDFNRTFVETITNILINTPGVFVISFILACIVNTKFHGRTIVRAILFIPVIVSAGAIASVSNDALTYEMEERMMSDANLFDSLSGFLLNSIQIDTGILEFVIDIVERIYDIIKMSGVQILLYLSGLSTISSSLYEASAIEGATSWENFWKITMPMISPYMLVCWVYTVIIQALDTNNGMMRLITDTSLGKHNYGLGAAQGYIYLAFVLVLVLVTSFAISKAVFYYDE